MNTIPVTIQNRQNLSLFGILHFPGHEIDRGNMCIVFLSPGVKSRVAPHRLYVKMARRLALAGYMVLRFDFSGQGDSEGNNDEEYLADLYHSIQKGKFTNDTIDAMNWLETHYQKKQFILAGLCGGALTGLFTGVKDQRVIAILSIGMSVILDSKTVDKRLYLTHQQIQHKRAHFLRKALHFNAWKRLLSLKSDFKLIYLTFIPPALKHLQFHIPFNNKANLLSPTNLNPLFHSHLAEFAKNRKILLVFGQSDSLLSDFEEKYLAKHEASYAKFKKNIELKIIPDANHILTLAEWTDEMFGMVQNWLNCVIFPN